MLRLRTPAWPLSWRALQPSCLLYAVLRPPHVASSDQWLLRLYGAAVGAAPGPLRAFLADLSLCQPALRALQSDPSLASCPGIDGCSGTSLKGWRKPQITAHAIHACVLLGYVMHMPALDIFA